MNLRVSTLANFAYLIQQRVFHPHFNIKSGTIVLLENSLVIDPPGLGFNFEISFTASFSSLSDKFNLSESLENFFLENNSNSDSIILMEFKIDSL